MAPRSLPDEIEERGYAVLPGVFPPTEVEETLHGLAAALATPRGAESALRNEEGAVYGARNVLSFWPAAAVVAQRPPLPAALADVLGPRYGLVRALYFDKPPGQTWALPWHKDLTVAVRDNRRPTRHFGKPTTKAGVPHAEAPRELLEAMLTARVHLDDVTAENGPLKVVPGSHRTGKELRLGDVPPESVLARRGDVLLMRPLVAHSSGRSHPDTPRHRRVLHLEFAAAPELPDGYEWHDFFTPAAHFSSSSRPE
ncbi:MAG TPA: phytanoyl-CoA dioxygenase family protein [Gemmataceae bacterium]|nr:phytanoyl-CoA dioxygenase family protein [Gemmataceae bacterium]